MKFSASLIALALIASQTVLAKPSKPIEDCAETQEVLTSDSTCDQFSAKWGINFQTLRELNPGLHANCDNLDL
ncbi:hypothetical protein BGX31_003009, partial [Mortierella sp. GBA43]